ncbi:MAG: methyltransferase domain-containing protein [Roseiflexaceae bacterium]
MATAATFNASIERWADEQSTPWGKLKYALVQANLHNHLPSAPTSILDAGGGNGFDSLSFAVDGYEVALVDYAQEMLRDAEHKAQEAHVQDRVHTYLADLTQLSTLFADESFDVIFCHNVLQHVDNASALLAALTAVLKPGGLLSLISVNRYSIPYHAAFMRNSLSAAYEKLDERTEIAALFGTLTHEYSAEEAAEMLTKQGYDLQAHYGIRCMCDYWGDNTKKSDPEIFAQIEQLEFALASRHPYKHLARYFHLIARKQGTPE